MKRVIAILIIILNVVQIYARQRISHSDILLPSDSLCLVSIGQNKSTFNFEVRAALTKNDEQYGKSREYWTLVWNYLSPTDYNYIRYQCANSDYGDFADKRYAQITIGRVDKSRDIVISTHEIDKNINTSIGYNSILLEMHPQELKVFIGSKKYQYVTTLKNFDLVDNSYCGIKSNVDIKIQSMVLDCEYDHKTLLSTEWTNDSLKSYFQNNSDAHIGYWTYLDRDNNPQKARCGGRYVLAVVKSDAGYDLIYVSGAETNSSLWTIGMLKGQLKPTIFKEHYDLIWYDSMFEVIETEAYVHFHDNAIMSLQFPLYETTIRFSKVK